MPRALLRPLGIFISISRDVYIRLPSHNVDAQSVWSLFIFAHSHTHICVSFTSWLNSLIFQFKSLVYPVFTFMLPLSIAGAQLCNNWVWIFKPHRIYNLMRAPVEKTKRPLELCLEIWIIKVGVHNLASAVKSPSSFKRLDTLLKDCNSSHMLGRRPF